MTPHCPTCGQAVEWIDTVHVDLDGNNIVAFGRCIHLWPREAEILWLLRERAPRVVSTGAIIQAVDPLGDLTDASVKVHVCRLRRKMAGLPWTIGNVHGVGYRFTVAQEVGHV